MIAVVVVVASMLMITAGSAFAATAQYSTRATISKPAALASGSGHHAAVSVTPKDVPPPLCYGSSCNGLDPNTENCWYNAYIADSAFYAYEGYTYFTVDNCYSPSCNANWNETYINAWSTMYLISITNANREVQCFSASTHDTCDPIRGSFGPNDSPAWTNMVDGSVKAQACVTFDIAGGPDSKTIWCGNWV
jgi:hypothetical protein